MTYKFGGTVTPARPEKSKPGPKPKPFSNDRCGETAGYKRHLKYGVPICGPCRAANTRTHRTWSDNKRRAS